MSHDQSHAHDVQYMEVRSHMISHMVAQSSMGE